MSEELEQLLKNLKLGRMLEIYEEQLRTAEKQDVTYSEFLTRLLRAQWHHRQESALEYRIRTARLPERWSLETFPFDRQPGVSRKQIRAFAEPNTLVHAGHMSLAQLYEDEGKFAEAEIHYKAALAEARKNGSISR